MPRAQVRRSPALVRSTRSQEPPQPGETEPMWIAAALMTVAGLVWVDYLFSGALTAAYLTGMMIVVIGVAILVPGNVPVKAARVIGIAITILLILLLAASGLPLATMEALSPIAQDLQDTENGISNGGNSINFVFVFVTMVVVFVLFAWMWASKRPWLIILLGVLIPLCSFFLIGIAGQAAIYDM